MNITAFCLDWHMTNSSAFVDILVDPLKTYADIRLTGWDGLAIPTEALRQPVLIFCMLPPSEEILKNYKGRLIWIPMWDQAQAYDTGWWQSLPKTLQVVAFSDKVYDQAKAASLPVLKLQYFLNPANTEQATWNNGRILYYWNRVGMVGPKFLERLCAELAVDTLLFKEALDPRIESNKYYRLPKKMGRTDVVQLSVTKDRGAFWESIKAANMVLAPRLTEGVGLVYLEAMSRGCAVLAHDAPTMNEYIVTRKNGVLLSNTANPWQTKLHRLIGRNGTLESSAPFLLNDQPWSQLARLDYEKLGNRALVDHTQGYQTWHNSLKAYADFVLK